MFAPDPELHAIDRLLDELPVASDDVGPVMRRAAWLLRQTLVRYHPSFRFEEGLAARLRAEAGGISATADPAAAARTARLIRFPGSLPVLGPDRSDADQPDRRGRGYLLGGAAIASASIATVVIAWRHVRERPA